MANLIGQDLGNYRIISLLGRGGMGEVYLGENIHIGTHVAIKVLHGNFSQQDKEDFKKEARTIANLTHPNIITLLDFGEHGNTFYMVMDYASNGSLRDRHARGSQVPLSIVVDYVKQIASGLQYAHDHKIVHRDINPANIFIGNSKEILIGDFGIAVTAHRTQTMQLQIPIGTPGYAAPEQYQGTARPASDQYALGVMVYEWLSGTLPVFPLQIKIPAIPLSVEQVALKALSQDPQQRFESVQKFAEALEQAASGQPVPPVILPANPPQILAPTMPVVAHPLGNLLSSYKAHVEGITALSWSPNGEYIVSKSINQAILIWKVIAQSSSFSYTFQTSFLKSLLSQVAVVMTWSPNGEYLAIGSSNGSIQIVEAASGRKKITYSGHTRPLEAISWSNDGLRIVSSESNGASHLWNVNSGDKELALPGCVVLSPDSTRITSTTPKEIGTVQVWNVGTRSKIFTYRGHSSWVNIIKWSPNGMFFASASEDGEVHVWETAVGDHVNSGYLNLEGKIDALLWSPNGKYLARSGIRTYAYSIRTKRPQYGVVLSPIAYQGSAQVFLDFSSQCSHLLWSPDGRFIALWSGEEFLIWDLISSQGDYRSKNGQIIFRYFGHSELSPDSTHVATASNDKTLQLWDATNGKHIFTYLSHPGKVTALAWSPDSRRVATGSDDGIVRIWQAV